VKRLDVVAEGTFAMVVLAVDVAGDGAADGDEASAGCDRHEEAARHDHAQQVIHADAGGHGDGGPLRVEHRLVSSTQLAQHQPAGVLRGVAVAAAEAAHQCAAEPASLSALATS
jgi:hypothetical protein